ncbi:MAG: hypothetical protein FWE90_13180 [Defluviitaleaceae bacterium]|nr:hypothetical protein [Defluviitaleaceae bacterium]
MKKIKFILFVCIMLCIIYFLGACGRGRNRTDDDTGSDPQPGIGTDSNGVGMSNPDTHTLTVAGPGGGSAVLLRQAGDRLRGEMAQQGIDLQIVYELCYATTVEERIDFYENIKAHIAAGQGPDVFITAGFPVYSFAALGLLADMYEILEGDFFDGVLDAYAVNGKLPTLPTTFGYTFVGVNVGLPHSFIGRFAQHDRISITELVLFYNDLLRDYPEYGHFEMAVPEIVRLGYQAEYGGRIDIENKQSQLDDILFSSLLNAMKPALGREYDSEQFMLASSDITFQSQNYVFAAPWYGADVADALLGQNPYFIHHIPLADEQGHLILNTQTLLCVSHLADGDLARAFIDTFMRVEAEFQTETGFFLRNIPTSQGLFTDFVDGLVSARLLGYTNETAWVPPQRFYAPSPEIPLARFTGGELTAQEFVQRNHDAVLEWMGREVTVRNIYIPIPEPLATPVPEAYVQHLTIQVWDIWGFEGVLAQAETAMNAERAARGDPYRVRLVPDVIHFPIDNLQANYFELVIARMQTMLMAGQGPDMFALFAHPYWNYALSGLLADIYPLIDQCPFSDREDFYTHMLRLFEVDGGLFAFPMSFSPEYVAINAGLPQHLIDRFARESVISYATMMEIYSELMRDYSDEFGHLRFGNSHTIGNPFTAALSVIGGFIDMENRIANLTDPRFVSFLHDWVQVFGSTTADDWFGEINVPGTGFDAYFEAMAMHCVFISGGSSGFEPANAFFPRNHPYFIHYAPLADEWGRLLIDYNKSWATFCLSAAGNQELSWEFLRHLTYAMAFPTPAAQYNQRATARNFGLGSMGTPIVRDYYEPHIRSVFDYHFDLWNSRDGYFNRNDFIGFDDDNIRSEGIERAIRQRATQNEMEIASLLLDIPSHFYNEPLNQLLRGLITPEAAAQRIQNTVSLWLMEQ